PVRHAYAWRDRASASPLQKRLARKSALLVYRDGLTATVTVVEDRILPTRDRAITTNGKYDGSSQFDLPTQRLLAHLPLLLHPSPERVCAIGLGTGCTAGSAALHRAVKQVTAAEIEDAIVDGARLSGE